MPICESLRKLSIVFATTGKFSDMHKKLRRISTSAELNYYSNFQSHAIPPNIKVKINPTKSHTINFKIKIYQPITAIFL